VLAKIGTIKKVIDKKELIKVGLIYLGLLIVFILTFYKEPVLNLLRITLGIFYLYVLPGYFLTLYYKERLDFFFRTVLGVVLNTAVLLIVSYYLGILGIHLKYHMYFLPPLFILAGIGIAVYYSRNSVPEA